MWSTAPTPSGGRSPVSPRGAGATARREAELRRLLEPGRRLGDRPDRARQADLAEIDGVRRQRRARQRGDERGRGGEVGGRLA